MRLTLRTLLAYSDDILDPADHEELGKKIEASDFATELIHRSRDTVRRLRLGAPEVFASGGDDVLDSTSAADANSVAEYLDNTLPAQEVADFERMCLEPGNEADMHLAEVASCHHVLTMVLGEPAEIDLDVRRRMYDLPQKIASDQQAAVDATPPPPQELPPQQALPTPVPPPGPSIRSAEAEVPDYLRTAAAERQRKKRWAVAAVLLAAAGIAGFFLPMALRQPKHPAELAEGGLDSIGIKPIIESAGDPEPGLTEEPEDLSTESSDEAPPLVADAPASNAEVAPLSDSPSDVFLEEIESQSAENMTPEGDLPNGLDEQPGDVDPEIGAAKPEELATATPGIEPLEFPRTAGETLGENPEMTAVDEAGEELLGTPSTADAEPEAAADELGSPPEPPGPKQLGNYLGNNDVLLRLDPSQDKWIRLPPRSAVSAGDSLLALPTFRPHVVLADVNTYLSGGARVDLPSGEAALADDEFHLELAVVYGKILLNAGLEGSRIGLRVGDQMRQVSLAGSTSLAVEVQRVFVPGKDNELEPSPVEATWYLTSGNVEWPGPAGEPQLIEAPNTWKTIAGIDDLPQPIDQLPEWIDREPMTDLQRRAQVTIAEELTPGEPVGLRLLELNDEQGKGRRSEVRTLAAESSVYVGEFEPFVKALNDKDQRRAWDSQIKTLRQALALSPQVAVQVRKAFVNIRGEQAGGDLMEMIAGYDEAAIGETREAVQNGALVKLIRWLESDSLDYRVLASYNLNEIIGATSLKDFQPGDSSRRRKIAVAKIWDSFESNELLPRP